MANCTHDIRGAGECSSSRRLRAARLALCAGPLRYGAGGPEIPRDSPGTQEAEVREDGLMTPHPDVRCLAGRDSPVGRRSHAR
jgi:hypothetical protein